eukprot:jgi/Botrbrau1/2196/Bobra.101_2s0027.1
MARHLLFGQVSVASAGICTSEANRHKTPFFRHSAPRTQPYLKSGRSEQLGVGHFIVQPAPRHEVAVRAVGDLAVPPPSAPADLGDSTNLTPWEATTLRFLGWISFWVQLGLSLVSAGVLFFTINSGLGGSQVPVFLGFTIGSVALSFVSTFLAYGYTRVARQVLAKGGLIKRAIVSSGILNSTRLNLVGLGLAIIGLQATVGTLVGKVLSSSSFNPLAQAQASPVAFDVYSIQASTNVILAHFVSLIFATWALNAFNKTAIQKVSI